MKKQNNPNIKAHLLRGAFYLLVLLALVFFAFSGKSALNLPGTSSGVSQSPAATGVMQPTTHARTLTFADRVAYQRAIEEIHWRHRDWPAADGSSKPSLDKLMPQAQMEKKVEDYLRNSQALENYWRKPITPDQLQAEMDRMARNSKQPDVLREIFSALGNDPYVIAECLARPALADRLARNLYAHDERFHAELKRRAAADLTAHHSVNEMKQTSGAYSEIELVKANDVKQQAGEPLAVQREDSTTGLTLNSHDWDENVQKLAEILRDGTVAAGVAPAQPTRPPPQKPITQIKTGVVSPLQEDDGRYYATAVISKRKDRLKLATIAWMKQPFDAWRAKTETQIPVTMAARLPADYRLPVIGNPAVQCTVDTWNPTALGAPEARYYHTAVWTGSEMIVWGGTGNFGTFNDGRRYDPATDTWTATSTTNATEARYQHTAVWTGTQMIVWGGYAPSVGYANDGGRYDPARRIVGRQPTRLTHLRGEFIIPPSGVAVK